MIRKQAGIGKEEKAKSAAYDVLSSYHADPGPKIPKAAKPSSGAPKPKKHKKRNKKVVLENKPHNRKRKQKSKRNDSANVL